MNDDTEFLTLADAKLEALEEQLAETCDELSTLRNGNVLNLDLDDGQQIVINIQTPMHEIWLASRFGGLHFRYTDGEWRDTRSDRSLEAVLTEVLAKLGIDVSLA